MIFRDKYFEILSRFYLTFESIYQYAVTLNSFVKDLSNGVYIQQTLETIFQDVEGKQLLVSVEDAIPTKKKKRIFTNEYRLG